MRQFNHLIVGVGITLAFMLGGCVCKPVNPEEVRIYEQNNDPFEPLNRTIFGMNQALDRLALKPMAKGYRSVVPELLRTGIGNFLNNLKQPIYLINAALQGEGEAAGQIAGRFAANTFWGFFGVFDTASQMEIPVVKRDFGETLAVWGVKSSGPYLMIPFLGPTTVRDGVGAGVDAVINPVNWTFWDDRWVSYTVFGMNALHSREQGLEFLDSLERSSTDYYATIRSMYQQNRQKEINGLLKNPDLKNQTPSYEFDFPDEEDE